TAPAFTGATRMSNHTSHRLRGFSLIEMVIVVVIIAILSAIAVPKLSRGSQGAAESALHGDLRVLRAAIDLYATEHGGIIPPDPRIRYCTMRAHTPILRAGPASSRRAFSLIEITLVLMVMGVLAALAVPRYASALARYRADAAARRIVADLDLARTTARSSG